MLRISRLFTLCLHGACYASALAFKVHVTRERLDSALVSYRMAEKQKKASLSEGKAESSSAGVVIEFKKPYIKESYKATSSGWINSRQRKTRLTTKYNNDLKQLHIKTIGQLKQHEGMLDIQLNRLADQATELIELQTTLASYFRLWLYASCCAETLWKTESALRARQSAEVYLNNQRFNWKERQRERVETFHSTYPLIVTNIKRFDQNAYSHLKPISSTSCSEIKVEEVIDEWLLQKKRVKEMLEELNVFMNNVMPSHLCSREYVQVVYKNLIKC